MANETQISKPRRALFASIIILVSIAVALIGGELLLRIRVGYIKKSDHLDQGLIKHDRHLGWRLTPNWTGKHKHYDFDVTYTTNSYGFRGDFMAESKRSGSKVAFVGDSFTFSFGVNDQETFVHLLNSRQPQLNTYLNFGIPGFSTDQEYLLIKEQVLYFNPDVILLVVYLGNDLFDNELAFPLQANNAKPYFELTADGLVLKNSPVPLKSKPKELARQNLMAVVLGDDHRSGSPVARFLSRFELLRLFKINLYKPLDPARFDDRFESKLRLFFAIVEQTRRACRQKGVQLSLVLMPGRSYVQRPGSPSAQFQNYLRRKIVENEAKIRVRVIDLASHLRGQYQKNPGKWYYPHEGHLTPAGHRVVADILIKSLCDLI